MRPSLLDDAKESLAVLEDTERFLLEDVGAGGELTLANSGKWANELATCREMIANQKRAIAAIELMQKLTSTPASPAKEET